MFAEYLIDKCVECKGYLSSAPILKFGPSIVCGQCVTTKYSKAPGIRATEYEEQAKSGTFNCSYDVNGCEIKLKWNEAKDHEPLCSYGSLWCPAIGCAELSVKKMDIIEHFESYHRELIVHNQIELSYLEAGRNEYNFLFVRYSEQFILRVRKVEEFLFLNCTVLNGVNKYIVNYQINRKDKTECENYLQDIERYTEKYDIDDGTFQIDRYVKIKSDCITCGGVTFQICNFDICWVRELLHSTLISSPPTHFIFKKLYELLQDVERGSYKTVKIWFENSLEEFPLYSQLKGLLICSICLDMVRPPVLSCTKGHIVCASCINESRLNCFCAESEFKYPYPEFDKVLENIPYPCINEDSGCTLWDIMENITLHENHQCIYRKGETCVLKREAPCSWTGSVNEFSKHMMQSHLPHYINTDYDISILLSQVRKKNVYTVYDKKIFKFTIDYAKNIGFKMTVKILNESCCQYILNLTFLHRFCVPLKINPWLVSNNPNYENTLTINTTTVVQYLERGTLKFNIRIENIDLGIF